jgi:hypothetical protein
MLQEELENRKKISLQISDKSCVKIFAMEVSYSQNQLFINFNANFLQ